jgi:hypothetical protein
MNCAIFETPPSTIISISSVFLSEFLSNMFKIG